MFHDHTMDSAKYFIAQIKLHDQKNPYRRKQLQYLIDLLPTIAERNALKAMDYALFATENSLAGSRQQNDAARAALNIVQSIDIKIQKLVIRALKIAVTISQLSVVDSIAPQLIEEALSFIQNQIPLVVEHDYGTAVHAAKVAYCSLPPQNPRKQFFISFLSENNLERKFHRMNYSNLETATQRPVKVFNELRHNCQFVY